MLKWLLSQDGYLSIEELASRFSVGKRTVSRDLDTLEHWLSLRGVILERRQNQGIRVLLYGSDGDSLLEKLNSSGDSFEPMEPHIRQQLTLLYLIFNNRETKIAAIAQAFFLSDTSVWNDLNQLEGQLGASGLNLERHKGVGIHLTGEEKKIRLQFIKTLTEAFSPQTIIPYLYAFEPEYTRNSEFNQFETLMKKIRFPERNQNLLDRIDQLQQEIGYRFTMSGQTLIYFYLQISLHRIKSGSLICGLLEKTQGSRFYDAAASLMKDVSGSVISGAAIPGEIGFLATLIEGLEVGDITQDQAQINQSLISPEVGVLTETMVARLGALDRTLYYLDQHLYHRLILSTAAMIKRIDCQIPIWHTQELLSHDPVFQIEEKSKVLSAIFKEQLNLSPPSHELNYLLTHFQALAMQSQEKKEQKIRCMVCCFEGIGVAAYLQALLKKELPETVIVESTAVYKVDQEYLQERRIDIILSTFDIKGVNIPVVPIEMPLNVKKLKKQVSRVMKSLKEKPPSQPQETLIPLRQETQQKIPFDSLWNFINNFSLIGGISHDLSAQEMIEALCCRLVKTPGDRNILGKDFLEREKLGSLYFEDYGVRVFHCKTSVFTVPRAGLMDHGTGVPRTLFLIAPDPCPPLMRKMVSEITLSFMDNDSFREALMHAELSEIKRALVKIYQNYL